MKIIIFKQENGNAAVIAPTTEYLKDHTIEECAAKDVPAGAEFHIIEEEDLPQEHNDFFNAWEVDSGKIRICYIKSQAITKDRLRQERKPLLEAQDVLYMRATEQGADTKAIVAEKQRLRDITKISVTTLDELKALNVH
jgi:hypothetical protein